MANFESVSEYIRARPKPTQKALKQLRATIRKALPDAQEVISYKIPAYKLNGKTLLYFAGWKEHYSLYPASPQLIAAFKERLAPYQVSKSTIRFPLSEPVPSSLIAAIAKFRAKHAIPRKRG